MAEHAGEHARQTLLRLRLEPLGHADHERRRPAHGRRGGGHHAAHRVRRHRADHDLRLPHGISDVAGRLQRGGERRVRQEHRVHVIAVDPLHHLRLERPDRDRQPLAREQIGERRAPRSGPDDGHPPHLARRRPHVSPFRVRKRFSVPARRRRRFARCEKTMSAARPTLAQNAGSAAGWESRTQTGKLAAAITELSDTYPVSHRMPPHTGSAIATARGAKARNIPSAVATPFPPRNPMYGENTWPSTAAIPSATAPHGPIPAHRANRATGTAPLAMSTSATGIAQRHPRTRYTLVAPRLRLPCSRRSIPRASRPAR